MIASVAAAAAAVILGGAGVLALSINHDVPDKRAPEDRPALALLTSLPLVFGESFSLDNGGSAALSRLEQRYTVQPIGVADAASLKGQGLLLMAHPRAQPAEALVELDRWVRMGGHVLLLADPRLDWPSERPLGDLLRPPPMFADTGLLSHRGMTRRRSRSRQQRALRNRRPGTDCTLPDWQGIGDGDRRCRLHRCQRAGGCRAGFADVRAGPSRDSLKRRESRGFPTILSTGLPSKNRRGTNGKLSLKKPWKFRPWA
jgi:hypothetical protein